MRRRFSISADYTPPPASLASLAASLHASAMKLLKELCSIPTAPFVEAQVVRYVEKFVRQRRRLRLSRDVHGNLLIELPGHKRGLPRWVFTAHMDHPGLVSQRMIDQRTVLADCRGWVLA